MRRGHVPGVKQDRTASYSDQQRSDVGRYQNNGIIVLLQRIEEYSEGAILSPVDGFQLDLKSWLPLAD